jgi:hypothetical protein
MKERAFMNSLSTNPPKGNTENRQPEQDLAFIRQLMERSRRVTVLGGHHFVAWGLLLEVGLLLSWLNFEKQLALTPAFIWGPLIVAGYAYTFWAQRRDRAVEGAESRDGYLIGLVWLCFGICSLMVLLADLWFQVIPSRALAGLFATLSGAAFFLHGSLAGIRWLRNVGILWWLAAIPLYLWPGAHTLPAYAVLLLLLQVVPGWILAQERRRLLAAEAGVSL